MIRFDSDSANLRRDLSPSTLEAFLTPIRSRLYSEGWEGDFASFLLPETDEYLSASESLASEFSDCGALLVVGIGGSNLGTAAVAEALLGKEGVRSGSKRLYFLDTVDSRKADQILSTLESLSASGVRLALATVSKSGSTTETAALTSLAYDRLVRNAGLSSDRTVAITEPGSKLHRHAESLGWRTLPMRPKVGGRYSVFSNVGLFPLAFLGIDVRRLLSGARRALADSFSPTASENAAYVTASFLFEGASEGRNVADHFFFVDAFESVGKWYRQLLGESVGKEFAKDGRKVGAGITPTVSIGSTDLHSVGQLYLGGPRDKSFVFVDAVSAQPVSVPADPTLDSVVANVAGRPLSEIMDAILLGTLEAYRAKGIPFVRWTLHEGSAEDLGYFLQSKMAEVAFLGTMFGVDPFDQPNVEDYKIGTKRILSI